MNVLDAWISEDELIVEVKIQLETGEIWVEGKSIEIHQGKFLFEPLNQPFLHNIIRFCIDTIDQKFTVLLKCDDEKQIDDFPIVETKLFDTNRNEIEVDDDDTHNEMYDGIPGLLEEKKIGGFDDINFNYTINEEENYFDGNMEEYKIYNEKIEEPEMEKIFENQKF